MRNSQAKYGETGLMKKILQKNYADYSDISTEVARAGVNFENSIDWKRERRCEATPRQV